MFCNLLFFRIFDERSQLFCRMHKNGIDILSQVSRIHANEHSIINRRNVNLYIKHLVLILISVDHLGLRILIKKNIN